MSRRGWWAGSILAVLLISAALFWFFRGEADDDSGTALDSTSASPDVDAPLKFDRKASAWEQPIEARGSQVITGRVVDKKGAPVAHATVTATTMHGDEVLSDLQCKCDNECGQKLLECGCPEASTQLVEHVLLRTGEAPPLARITTDGEGRFTLQGLEAGEVALWADAPRLIGFRPSVKVGDAEVELRVDEGRTVKGKVLTGDDKPASGALVTGIYAAHSRFFDVSAKDDGTFELGPIPKDGVLAVVAMKDGLLPDNAHARPSEDAWSTRDRALKLVLHAPRALAGVVTRGGAPVEGVQVSIDGEHKKKKTLSDSGGAFRFSGLRPGRYDVSASDKGDIASVTATLERTLDKEGVALDLAPGYVIRGSVTDSAGQPLQGVEVSADGEQGGSETYKTKADGSFELEPLPPGEWTVYASGKGLLAHDGKQVTIATADVRVEFTLQRGSPISGVVVDPAGLPVVDARVSASPLDGKSKAMGDSDRTADGGTFTLDRLEPGAYDLTVDAKDFPALSQHVTAPTSGLRLVLVEGSSITGVVVEPSGQPVAGARISVAPQDVDGRVGPTTDDDRTDETGRFVVKGLKAMNAHIWASAISDRVEDEKAFVPSMRVGVAKAVVPESGSVEVRITLPEAMSLSGVVLDENSAPVAGAVVRAESQTDRDDFPTQFAMGSATSGADGRFTIEGLVSGKLRVTAGKADYAAPSERGIAAVAGQKNVVLRLERLPEVTGRVVDENGTPLTEFRVGRDVKRAEDGRFSASVWFGKQSKESFLDVEADGFAAQRIRFERFSGRKEVGDVRLERGRMLSGRVVDAVTGAPVAGATVGAITPEEASHHGSPSDTETTDRQGRFKLDRVDARATVLVVRHHDYLDSRQPFERRAEELVVRVDPGAVLELTATYADGQPARGVVYVQGTITIEGQTSTYRGASGYLRDGRFRKQGLLASTYLVRIQGEGGDHAEALFRSVVVQLGAREKKSVSLTEATDGAEVQLAWSTPPHPSAYAALYPGPERATGRLPTSRELDLSDSFDFDRQWTVKRILPGTYSLLIFANAGIARSVVNVTSEPKQKLQLPFPTQFEKPSNAWVVDDD